MLFLLAQIVGVAMMQGTPLSFVASTTSWAPHVVVVGAHGALGRELTYQCVQRGWKVTALTRRDDPICQPDRSGWLNPELSLSRPIINSTLLQIERTRGSRTVCPKCDTVVFALSGKPFRRDDTTSVVRSICESLPLSCKGICLVSAHGVNGGGNVGIRIMREWYLESTYAAKKDQEDIVQQYDSATVRTRILRPRVLSYASIPMNPISTPRYVLASNILDWIGDDLNMY